MKEIIKCKFEELDDILENIMEYGIDEYEVNIEDIPDKLCVMGYRILFPAVNYSVRSGLWLSLYDDGYMADFSLSLVYDYDEEDPTQWLYWEQDGEVVSLYNFLTIVNEGNMFHALEGSECIIELELWGDEDEEAQR